VIRLKARKTTHSPRSGSGADKYGGAREVIAGATRKKLILDRKGCVAAGGPEKGDLK